MEDKQQAFKDLQKFKNFCDKHKIKFWLDWGTLLGAVRSGEFIPWEQDIDLGFYKQDLTKVVKHKKTLEKLGFRLYKKPEGYALIHKGLTSKIDLGTYNIKNGFAYQTCDDYNRIGEFCDALQFILSLEDPEFKYETILSINTLSLLVKVTKYLPLRKTLLNMTKSIKQNVGIKKIVTIRNESKYFDSFDTVMFYGQKFRVPNNTQKYLESIYGRSWETPKNWIKDKSDKWSEFRNVKK